MIRCKFLVEVFAGSEASRELLEKGSEFRVIAEKGRSMLRHYKDEEKSAGLKTGYHKLARANRQLGMGTWD